MNIIISLKYISIANIKSYMTFSIRISMIKIIRINRIKIIVSIFDTQRSYNECFKNIFEKLFASCIECYDRKFYIVVSQFRDCNVNIFKVENETN